MKPRARAARTDQAPASSLAGLAAAAEAIDRNDYEAALARLLEAWRIDRAPEIAALVETVSTHLTAHLPAIIGTNRKALQDQWLAVAGGHRPADLPRLLDSITVTFYRATDALSRVRAIADWPTDPRTAGGVVRQLKALPFYAATTRPFWRALIKLAIDHGDPRTIAAFEALRFDSVKGYAGERASIIAWFEREVRAAAVALRSRYPDGPLAIAEAAGVLCARIAEQLGATRGDADALLTEIAEHPDDDQARLVFADQLQQAGDPRGELIALQIGDRDPQRQRELVAAHAHTWLGPLVSLADLEACRFERGFPETIALRYSYRSVAVAAPALAAVAGHPVWSTVRRLDLGGASPLPTELLRHRAMRSLEHVHGLARAPLLEMLQWRTIAYRSLGCLDDEDGPVDIEALIRASPKLTQLCALSLAGGVQPSSYRRLWSSPLGSRIERLTVNTGSRSLADWIAEAPQFDRALRVVELTWTGNYRIARGTIEIGRDPDDRMSIVDARLWFATTNARGGYFALSYERLSEAIASVPRNALTRLRVHGRPPRKAERAALLAACAQFHDIAIELP